MLDPVFAVCGLEGKDGGKGVEKVGAGERSQIKNRSAQSGTQVFEVTEEIYLKLVGTTSRFESNKRSCKD